MTLYLERNEQGDGQEEDAEGEDGADEGGGGGADQDALVAIFGEGDADDANRPPDQPVEGVPVVPGERPAAPKPKAKKGPVQELLNLLGARSMRSTKASMVDSVVDAYLAKRMAAQASVSGASD